MRQDMDRGCARNFGAVEETSFPNERKKGGGGGPANSIKKKLFSAGPLYIGDPPLQSDALQDHRITDVSASTGEAEANPTQTLTFPKRGKK